MTSYLMNSFVFFRIPSFALMNNSLSKYSFAKTDNIYAFISLEAKDLLNSFSYFSIKEEKFK